MTQKPWFGPKRYGFGIRPVSWQGWLLTLGLPALLLIVTMWLTGRG